MTNYLAQDPLKRAAGVNRAGKVILLLIVVIFNLVFWTIAINEYITPAETYLERLVEEEDS